MVSALIVTIAYNPPQSVINNLEIDYYRHMIVDNSEIETIWLKEYCAENNHIYQWLGDNFGIAKALNVGAKYALSCGYDYIVTMDQDSELSTDILARMCDAIEMYEDKAHVAIFSPRHINDGVDLHIIKSDITNDFYTMSSGNFLNLDLWYKLNKFDEKLFIDMVDVDYYVRAIIANYQVITFQQITMQHRMGDHSHIRWVGKYGFDVWNHSKVRKYYQARNFWYVYNKYHTQLPELIFIKKMIRKMPISIILFENDKINKLYYFLRGYVDYVRGKFGKIYF